jgi:hypothetical protein
MHVTIGQDAEEFYHSVAFLSQHQFSYQLLSWPQSLATMNPFFFPTIVPVQEFYIMESQCGYSFEIYFFPSA